jgi:hypothetical protein
LQHVTYHLIQRSIFSLWAAVVLLVSLPLLGFGKYYSPGPPLRCERYRQATDPVGTAYAYLYFAFGELVISGTLWIRIFIFFFMISAMIFC